MEINILGSSQGTKALTAATAGQTASKLSAWGTYVVWCDEGDVYVKLHPTDATTGLSSSTGFKIPQNTIAYLHIESDTDLFLGGICAATATLRYHKVG